MGVFDKNSIRNIEVNGYDIQFYFWGDDITPAIKVSIIKETQGLLFKRKVAVYSENHMRYHIKSYKETALEVIRNYENELSKWD